MVARVLIAGLWILLGLLLTPVLPVVAALHPALRRHFRERLGFPVVEVEPGAIWFHAASLGEGRIVEALAPPLRARWPEVGLLRTFTSAAAANQVTGVDQTLALPLDNLLCVLAFLDRARPRALILVEAELWPALLLGCRLRGVSVTLLSPRDGPGMARLRRLAGLRAALLAGVRIVQPGCDLKQAPARRRPAVSWRGEALIAACTHEGEEAAVVEAWLSLPARPMLVVAPRDPDRFHAVASLLAALAPGRFRFVRRSALGPAVPDGTELLLLDSVGELASLYAAARAAFIGGTFDAAVGGHSPAEALAAGCAVARGPEIGANRPAWETTDAVVAADPGALSAAFAALLARPKGVAPPPPAVEAVLDELDPLAAAPIPRERWIRPWLAPLVPVWRSVSSLRVARLHRASIHVISVGALTAGGAGKTPVAAWLAARIPGAAVVSRGYRRDGGGEVRTEGEAKELGDELTMLRRRGIAVVSSPDRVAGVAHAAKRGARTAILDDGLQNRSVARDLEIVVLDARWPEGGGPIPVGSGRVSRGWLRHADVVWVNHGEPPAWVASAIRPGALVVQARYRAVGWRVRGAVQPLSALPVRPALALAGIARPEGFFRQLRALGVNVVRTVVFPDHHRFSWHDLQSIEAWKDDHVVVATEKDAARLPDDAGVWALVVEVDVVAGQEALLARLSAFGATA